AVRLEIDRPVHPLGEQPAIPAAEHAERRARVAAVERDLAVQIGHFGAVCDLTRPILRERAATDPNAGTLCPVQGPVTQTATPGRSRSERSQVLARLASPRCQNQPTSPAAGHRWISR